jgi:coatomer protein complex subunit gamma
MLTMKFAIELRYISRSSKNPDWLKHTSRMVRANDNNVMVPVIHCTLDSVFSLLALESKLVAYVRDPDATNLPFDVSSVPKVSREQAAQEVTRELSNIVTRSRSHYFSGPSSLDTIGAPASRTTTPAPPPPTAEETQSAFIQQLTHVPELAPYGTVINSSKPVQLTENETEYQVSCVKHVFREHIVFQVCVAILSHMHRS